MSERVPTLTPLEADRRMRATNHETFTHDGWTYTSDGPQMSPPEFWAPSACHVDDKNYDHPFYCTGEPGTPIDESTRWIAV